jgi:ABC-type multidrug transport system ATPase subunit
MSKLELEEVPRLSAQEKVIEIRDLIKTFDGKTNAVDGISFEVWKGEIFGV